MKKLITQLKRNIYEVKNDREKIIKEISQGRKIHQNLQRARQTVAEDNIKLQKDFSVAFDKKVSAKEGGGHD